MLNNPVVFWELASHDAEQTVTFLERVFGMVHFRPELGLHFQFLEKTGGSVRQLPADSSSSYAMPPPGAKAAGLSLPSPDGPITAAYQAEGLCRLSTGVHLWAGAQSPNALG